MMIAALIVHGLCAIFLLGALISPLLAIILAFVGIKMIIADWYHIPTWLSLLVIALVLAVSITISLRLPGEHDTIELVTEPEPLPPPDER